MLKERIIIPIQSPYASAVVLFKNNNGLPPDNPKTYRFAVDYRKLNSITKYPHYLLALIDDLIRNIRLTAMMSALDFRSGYFQLAVNPSDIVKTTFVTKNDTYTFRRMPFGLSWVAANFQKAISIILKPVIGKFVNVYMDDIIISSPSFTQHIEHLVFRLLQDAGLTLNKGKCKFGCDELKYLGLIINKEGIKTNETKVRAIVEMKPPRNSKEVSKFLGMFQWYAKFIKNYANLCPYPASRVRRNRYALVITDHFSKWAGIIPLKKASARVIADNIFDNYTSLSGAPVKLIIDNGPQFISDIFEHLSERLGVRHVKTVVYRPQADRNECVNRDIVQMIANYANYQHDTWDQFLREFTYAIRTEVNKTTGKPPAELFLGRKLITSFQKLVMVSDGTEFAVRDIERLFDEAKRNTKTKHEKWEKYYNRWRRDVQIKVNDWVLIATHPLSSATKKVVAKFKPKFEGPYRVLEVKK
ncbi:retrovirus-related Pol polyprotein from transposon opus [Trichonephila clavipes]|nr:retrovirus-related Pol polyprotein from transposon opus [Trichonephila clavipes]